MPLTARVKGQCCGRHVWEFALSYLPAATKLLNKLELPTVTLWEWLRSRAFRKSLRKALAWIRALEMIVFLHNWNLFTIIWLDFLIHENILSEIYDLTFSFKQVFKNWWVLFAIFQPQNNNQSSTTSDSLNSLSVIGNFMEAMDTIVSGGQLNITAGDGAPLTPTGPLNVVRPVQLLCELGEVLRNNSCSK